jgi:hypothetical protein
VVTNERTNIKIVTINKLTFALRESRLLKDMVLVAVIQYFLLLLSLYF